MKNNRSNYDQSAPPPREARAATRAWRGLPRCAAALLAASWLAFGAAQAQAQNYSLGTTNLLEGPTAGAGSVVLAVTPSSQSWTATANDSWLHLSAANQSGAGSGNVVFTFDANPGATRTGTLTIAGQMLTVTQAGATYVAASPVVTLVSLGTNTPVGVAVDGGGNVYFAAGSATGSIIQEWSPAPGVVTTLVSAGLAYIDSLAVDSTGNVCFYVSNDPYLENGTVQEWIATTNTVITLISSNSIAPPGESVYWLSGVAVDSAGNIYYSDVLNSGAGVIQEWIAATGTVTNRHSDLMLSDVFLPIGTAVDRGGNVYFADWWNGIVEWVAATRAVTGLVSYVNSPQSVAVDGAGNVYFSGANSSGDGGLLQEWTAATGAVTTLFSSEWAATMGVAVDGAGNVYFADQGNNEIDEVPHAFVDPTGRTEPAAAGGDVLPVVLPATANLSGPFAPTCDQAWLTITGVTNGLVSYAFTANASNSPRTAHISLLGQSIAITQIAAPILTTPRWLPGGSFRFGFTGTPGASYSVLYSTNAALPLSSWTVVGTATETTPGHFQFTATRSPAAPGGFYRVRSP